MAARKAPDPGRAREAARAEVSFPMEEYLSRVPQDRFPHEFAALKERLSRMELDGAAASQFFAVPSLEGGGIYVQGPQVIFKNVLDATGTPASPSFFIDDVAVVHHHAKLSFVFLVLAWSWQSANCIVIFDPDYRILATVPASAAHKDFLLYLLATNPRIVLDSHVWRFVSGDQGVFRRRMMGLFLLALLGNVMLYVVVITALILFDCF